MLWPDVRLLGRDRSPSGPALRRSMSADAALSEKSPYLGGARVGLGFWEVCLSRTSRTRQALPSSSNLPSVSSGVTDPHHLVAVTSSLSH